MSGDWLMKNFQSFASFAKLRDIIKLNMNFSAVSSFGSKLLISSDIVS